VRRAAPQALGVLAVAAAAFVWARWGGAPTADAVRRAFGALDPVLVLELAAAAIVVGLASALLPRRPAVPWRLPRPHVPTAVALAAIVALAAVFRVSLGGAYHLPTVLGDELIYSGLAKGWALHGEPFLRGSPEIGYSTVYPLFLAPAFALAADGAHALEAVKVLNAVAMASAAVPAYLLARRAVTRGWALGVALLSVAVPWTAYSALTLTEPLFYPVFVAYAALLAATLERPIWPRQAALLALLVVLVGIRTQALAIALGTLAAIAVHGTWRRFGPTIAALALATAAGVGASVAGVALPTSTYDPIFGSIERVGGMLEWTAWSLGSFELALGVLPLVAFPVAVRAMLRDGDGPRAAAAVAVGFGVSVLASVALLSASPYGLERLHERSLFFVTPLVLLCFAHWLSRGRRRPGLLSLGSAVAGVAFAAVLPRDLVFGSFVVDAPSTVFFRELDTQVAGVPFRVWAVASAAVGAATFLLARRALFPIFGVALAFAAVTARVDYADALGAEQAHDLSWVDHALPVGADVTLVNLGLKYGPEPCASAAWNEQQRFVVWTEYFNTRVDAVAWLYEPNHFDGVPSRQLTVGSGGLVVDRGRPFAPEYVVIDSRQRVTGVPVERSHLAIIDNPVLQQGASLTLWRVDPPLRLYPLPQPPPPRGDGRGC
jgi:hypothetical protein